MKKIIIAEDDMILAEEVKKLLENNGYEAEILKSFDKAADTILMLKGDMLLLDINLPKISGQFLLGELRNKTDIPIIMLTSRDTELDEVMCIQNGADDFITKPYKPMILLSRIAAVFRRTEKSSSIIEYKDIKLTRCAN